MSLSDEEILELAKNCEIDFSIKWRLKGGKSSNQMYWECWEEQLLKFAQLMYVEGYEQHRKDILGEELYYD
jgi:hypothetical protein